MVSCLAGGHKYFFPRVVELLREKGMDDIIVLGGVIIPDEDIPLPKEKGIRENLGTGVIHQGHC